MSEKRIHNLADQQEGSLSDEIRWVMTTNPLKPAKAVLKFFKVKIHFKCDFKLTVNVRSHILTYSSFTGNNHIYPP